MGAPEELSAEERALRGVIADNLRRLIAASGKTVGAVADFAELSRSHLDYVMKGEKAPTSDTIARLARALDIEPWQLLQRSAP